MDVSSRLRLIYGYKEYTSEEMSPLQYAIEKGIYFKIGETKNGDGIFLTPLTESFRRHIIFIMDKNSNITFKIEFKMPGEIQSVDKKTVKKDDFEKTKELYDATPEDKKNSIVKPLFMVKLPKDIYEVYGDKRELDTYIVVYDYKYDAKRMVNFKYDKRNLPAQDLEEKRKILTEWAEGHGMQYEELAESIVTQIFDIVSRMHYLGYKGVQWLDKKHLEKAIELHLENFRLFFDENNKPVVSFVGDASGFEKMLNKKLATKKEKEKMKEEDRASIAGELNRLLDLSIDKLRISAFIRNTRQLLKGKAGCEGHVRQLKVILQENGFRCEVMGDKRIMLKQGYEVAAHYWLIVNNK